MKSKFSYLLAITVMLAMLASCGEKVQTDNEEEEENKPEVVEPSFDKTKIDLTQKELRGVWFTTVWNIDWPNENYYNNPEAQKKEMIEYFDLFKELGINCIFFQIRGMADSFYDSKYEPWSKVFTGYRGKNPGWEPLKFAIEEAHKRGMQLHAWMNPYRIQTGSNFGPLDKKIPKELVKDYAGIRMYNPALPEARQRIADIVKEVITNFDVDGVHFDDYFYPAPEQCSNIYDDEAEYNKYKKNGQSIKDFRFDNVNQMVQLIQKTIKETKPNVIFTISPSGNMAYNMQSMYADVAKWCSERWIDAVIPQLYWGRKLFDPRLEEFCTIARKTPVLVGYATYNFAEKPQYDSSFKNANLFKDEHEFASGHKQVQGSVHYNASALRNNNVGITDMVRKVYEPLRLMPHFGKDETVPATPTNAKIAGNKLTWDGDGVKFAIYKDKSSGRRRGRSANLIGITTSKEFEVPGKGTYYVTAIDKYNAESLVTDMIELK